MGLDVGWFRRSLMVSLGLVGAACGPGSAGSGSGDGEGDGDSGDGTVTDPSVGTTGVTTTGASTEGTGSTTTPPSWPDPPWCDVAPPADVTPPATCTNPQPIMQESADGSVPTGLVRCDEGFMHRESSETCLYPPQLTGSCDMGTDTDGDTGVFGECSSDADCDAAPHGYCNFDEYGKTCGCDYGCETDADCDTGQLCACFGAGARCVTANCTSDADCGDYFCARLGSDGFSCHGPFDTCHTLTDCPDQECPSCAYSATNCAWACEPEGGVCTIGRPFLIDGSSRIASVVARTDWSAALAGRTDPLAPELRERLARYWIEVGLAEHASVPAFARFALQLVALGAPARLLAETASAMSDEIEHARLAFALATRYGAVAVGPGELALDGALAESCEAVAVAALAVREACIGETLAAIEAARALSDASDPQVREVLRKIADDELRHAELGWRFVAWVVARADERGRSRIRRAFADAIADARVPVGEQVAEPELRAHGMIDADHRTAIRRRALDEVIVPIVGALVGAARPQPSPPQPRSSCA